MQNTKIILITGSHYSGKHYFEQIIKNTDANITSITMSYNDFVEFIQSTTPFDITASDKTYTLIVPPELNRNQFTEHVLMLKNVFGRHNILIVSIEADPIEKIKTCCNDTNLLSCEKLKICNETQEPHGFIDTDFLAACIRNKFDGVSTILMEGVAKELSSLCQKKSHYNVQAMINRLTKMYTITHVSTQNEDAYQLNIDDTIDTVYFNPSTNLWERIRETMIPIKYDYLKRHEFKQDVIQTLKESKEIPTRYVDKCPNMICLNTGEQYDMASQLTGPGTLISIRFPIRANKVLYAVSTLTVEEQKIFDYIQNMFDGVQNITKNIIKSLMCPAESAGLQIILNCTNDKEQNACELFIKIAQQIAWCTTTYNSKFECSPYDKYPATVWIYNNPDDPVIETNAVKTDNILTPILYNSIILRILKGEPVSFDPVNQRYKVYRPYGTVPSHSKLSDDSIKHIAEQLVAWVMEYPNIDPDTGNALGFKNII